MGELNMQRMLARVDPWHRCVFVKLHRFGGNDRWMTQYVDRCRFCGREITRDERILQALFSLYKMDGPLEMWVGALSLAPEQPPGAGELSLVQGR